MSQFGDHSAEGVAKASHSRETVYTCSNCPHSGNLMCCHNCPNFQKKTVISQYWSKRKKKRKKKNKMDKYIVIQWPEIQEFMEIEDFRENSYLINDEKGLEDFDSSAYFVKYDWYKKQIF